MGFTGFPMADFTRDLRRYVSEYASAESRAMQYEVAVVEIYVYRVYGDGGPRSYRPDISRISSTDSTFGDGWGVSVQHHNETTAATLGRHVMFCSDGHLAEDRDVVLYATAQAICAFAAGRITHSPHQLFPDSRSGGARTPSRTFLSWDYSLEIPLAGKGAMFEPCRILLHRVEHPQGVAGARGPGARRGAWHIFWHKIGRLILASDYATFARPASPGGPVITSDPRG